MHILLSLLISFVAPPPFPDPGPAPTVEELNALLAVQQEQIAVLTAELAALRNRLTDRTDWGVGDPIDSLDGRQMIIEPQSGVPVLARSRWIAIQTGAEIQLVPIWRDGRYLPIDVIHNAPRDQPQRMEIFRGSDRTVQEFPRKAPLLPPDFNP